MGKLVSLHYKFERRLCIFFAIIIYLILIAVTFGSLTTLGFATPDDHWMLLKNEFVHPDSLSWDYFVSVMKRINGIQYSPINTFYYYLVYKINGYDPYYFHIFNLLIHIFNSILLFIISKKLLFLFTKLKSTYLSYFVCLIWVIHPFHVETIAWVSGSKILLCTFFTLLSLLFFLRGIESEKSIFYFGSLLFFLISFLCKEQAILTPVMIILIYVIFSYKSYHKLQVIKRPVITLGVMLLFTIVFTIFTLYVNEFYNANNLPAGRYSFFERIVLSFYCLRFYIANLVLPINLHYGYAFPFVSGYSVPLLFTLYAIIFVPFMIIVYYLVRKCRYAHLYAACIGVFLVQISVELQVIPMTRPAIVADRYMYLPSFFLILIALHACSNLRASTKNIKWLLCFFFFCYLLYFSLYSNILVF